MLRGLRRRRIASGRMELPAPVCKLLEQAVFPPVLITTVAPAQSRNARVCKVSFCTQPPIFTTYGVREMVFLLSPEAMPACTALNVVNVRLGGALTFPPPRNNPGLS